LAGAAELHDVGAVVVGFDDAWQGAAFAQRRDIPDRLDVFEHSRSLVGSAGL